jgi:integrase/recombinase XerD
MIYTFARVGAALEMNVGDYFTRGDGGWVRLHEKGGKGHQAPYHHKLEAYWTSTSPPPVLLAKETGRCSEPRGKPPVRSTVRPNRMPMIQRRACAAGIRTKIGNHSLRATGITD